MIRTDGRNIDQTIGALRGEGSLQRIENPQVKQATANLQDADSYYGMPLLKAAVWKWPVPTYFYVGGLAGASAVIAAAATHVPAR